MGKKNRLSSCSPSDDLLAIWTRDMEIVKHFGLPFYLEARWLRSKIPLTLRLGIITNSTLSLFRCLILPFDSIGLTTHQFSIFFFVYFLDYKVWFEARSYLYS